MYKILIIEDDESIVRMLKRRLKKRGYEIHVASNGKIGTGMVFDIHPDFILMDMHMPIMNGYEATRFLREQNYTGLIIALTASAMASETPRALEAGCDYYLTKPIGISFEDELERIVDEFRGKNDV